MKNALQLLVSALAILLAAYLLPGVHIEGFLHALLVALVLALFNLLVKTPAHHPHNSCDHPHHGAVPDRDQCGPDPAGCRAGPRIRHRWILVGAPVFNDHDIHTQHSDSPAQNPDVLTRLLLLSFLYLSLPEKRPYACQNRHPETGHG
jgi:hypothetical protein